MKSILLREIRREEALFLAALRLRDAQEAEKHSYVLQKLRGIALEAEE
ncbi:hypothetical protein [Bacillus sp. FSL K6-3431]